MESKKKVKEYTVTEDLLASNVGSGSLPVLATPAVSAFFEETSAELAKDYLDSGFTTVGSKITVEHLAPTALGCKVTVKSELAEHSGRFFRFNLSASDNAGVIAKGVHERVSVSAEKFMGKVRSRKNEGAE